MKFAILFAIIAAATAYPYGGQSHGYGHGGYVQPTHHQVHAYAAKAPHVQCGQNLLVGCQPHVAKVPCVPSHGHEYGHAVQHAGYGHATQHAGYGHKTESHKGYRAFGDASDFESKADAQSAAY